MKSGIKISIIIFLIVIFTAVTGGGYFCNEFFVKRPISDATAVSFSIESGESVKKIARNLEEAGIINGTFIFETYVWLLQLDGVFQPGQYDLKPGNNIAFIVNELTAINITENKVTIIEGWTLRDIVDNLLNKKIIQSAKDFYYLTGTPAIDYRNEKVDFRGGWNYDFLSDRPAYATLEGYIYPDTYRALAERGAGGIIEKALNNFGKKLTADLRVEIKNQGKTIFEVITLASIVEKEIFGSEDRKIVADLFLRRLKMGMPLQADSTINYITQSGRARSTYDDLKINLPWNTYKYKGLPLGPISNPSIEAIRAVIYPQPNNYLYFLTGKDGVVHYAKNAAEHAKNRTKYLQ